MKKLYIIIIKSIKNLVDTWCLRKLTLKGKIIIANTTLISQMIYAGTVLQPPKWVIEQYKTMLMNFIWNKKPAKVKYACMINIISEDGMKLQDLATKINACQMASITGCHRATVALRGLNY